MSNESTRRSVFGVALLVLVATGASIRPAHAQVISDTSPPQLAAAGLAFTPTSVDVTLGLQTVTVTATVTDNLAGTTGVSAQFVSPSGAQTAPLSFAFLPRISGTALSGTYRGTIQIPQFSQAGVWTLRLSLSDAAGNSVALSAANLQALGLPTQLAVTSVADTTAPNVTSFNYTDTVIDVSGGTDTLELNLGLSDDISGVDITPARFLEFRVVFRSPSGVQQQFASRAEFTMTSGTTLNGTWRVTRSFPQFSEPGTWTISQLRLIDFAGNQRFLTTANLRTLGFNPDFTVVSSPSDTTLPQVTGLVFDPVTFDTSASFRNVTVRLTITDDLAGISFGNETSVATQFKGVQFRSQSGVQFRSSSTFTLIAGTPLNGTWQSTVFFPQFSEGGTWTVTTVSVKDGVNNFRTLSAANLTALGLPTQLTIAEPAGTPDGAPIGASGGTVTDGAFGNRAILTVPPGAFLVPTTVAIDVLAPNNNLGLPTPAGFTAGTLFVNINLNPVPAMPFPSPGMTVVLPFTTFRTPGSLITLFRLDPVIGLLVPAPKIGGGVVIGTVNADGLSATFTGVAKLSTVVGFFSTGVLGDVDGDGTVDCTDLAIVKAAFGRRIGQAGFDGRADLNRNGLVDVNDLALVSRQLPPGTFCSTPIS